MSEMTIIPDLYLEGNSKQWKNRQAIYLDIKTCQDCRKKHGKIYENRRGLLPERQGRIWREADFDFIDGYRNSKRILYSNDGLIFISYDHAKTFYELVE